ncbi:MAG: DUF4347 domain-containing protein [Deltaproteobacteria bacterium]|nr:DUF4347 domain-containing protein [Deltaproteobacteria bacterium]
MRLPVALLLGCLVAAGGPRPVLAAGGVPLVAPAPERDGERGGGRLRGAKRPRGGTPVDWLRSGWTKLQARFAHPPRGTSPRAGPRLSLPRLNRRSLLLGSLMLALLVNNVSIAATRGPNLDAFLDGNNPFVLYESRVLGISHTRLAPPEWFTTGDGPVVGINGVEPGEMYLQAADYMTGAEWANGTIRVQVRATSPENLIEQLLAVYRRSGPIKKVVIAAHGSSGSMNIGGVKLDVAWVRAHAGYLAQLPPDLLAKDAQIVLISCSTAQGYWSNPGQGERALREIFTPLLRQGGTIVASRRYVDPTLADIPDAYKSPGERVARHLLYAPVISLLETVEFVLSDGPTLTQKVDVIHVAGPSGR